MAVILITSEYFGKFTDKGYSILKDAGHTVLDPYGHRFVSTEDIINHIKDADGIICDLEPITAQVIDAAPNLRIISRRGVGVDSVDVKYAEQKGIKIARTLGVLNGAVAELVMAQILHFSRNIALMDAKMKAGIWEKQMGHSLEGKTLGILGMGNIGCQVAKRAAAFDMDIIYHNRSRNLPAEKKYGAKYVSFEDLIKRSDFLTIHVPSTKETESIIDYDCFCNMKPTAFIINTARGAVVNTNDLDKALSESLIAGAAVDVFDKEPCTDSVLKKYDNVILTPHVGSSTKEVFAKMDVAAAQNIVDFFNSEK